ncbi:MAG: Hsp20/alpha crystallin family protein [Gammaproteobacteria bacterium]|nr:MAG: Hsp20/alpha crystallin family protein [Gammaproteobacteria bacterium]
MSSLKQNLDRAWSQVQAGWNNLVSKASNALTHFSHRKEDEADAQSRALLRSSPEWGLLAAEVHESGDDVTVRLEVPGLEPADLDVEVVDRTLIVRGQKQISHERKEGRYHITECAYGSFERRLPLPAEVDPGQAKASYKKGVLTLELPKSEHEKVRRIPIAKG